MPEETPACGVQSRKARDAVRRAAARFMAWNVNTGARKITDKREVSVEEGHAMKRVSAGTNVFIYPIPVVLVGTNAGWKAHFVAAGWVSRVNARSPRPLYRLKAWPGGRARIVQRRTG